MSKYSIHVHVISWKKECNIQEKDKVTYPKIVNLGSSKTCLFYDWTSYGFKKQYVLEICIYFLKFKDKNFKFKIKQIKNTTTSMKL